MEGFLGDMLVSIIVGVLSHYVCKWLDGHGQGM